MRDCKKTSVARQPPKHFSVRQAQPPLFFLISFFSPTVTVAACNVSELPCEVHADRKHLKSSLENESLHGRGEKVEMYLCSHTVINQ